MCVSVCVHMHTHIDLVGSLAVYASDVFLIHLLVRAMYRTSEHIINIIDAVCAVSNSSTNISEYSKHSQ